MQRSQATTIENLKSRVKTGWEFHVLLIKDTECICLHPLRSQMGYDIFVSTTIYTQNLKVRKTGTEPFNK